MNKSHCITFTVMLSIMKFFFLFRQEVDMLARSLGCKLICTSVKDDVNVNNVFRYLATRCLMEIQKEEQEYMSGNGMHQTYTIGKLTINTVM